MAYNPKSDINEIAYLKREYERGKAAGDTGLMTYAQDSAKKYYDSLVANGYANDANYLKGANGMDAYHFSKTYSTPTTEKKKSSSKDLIDTYRTGVDNQMSEAESAARIAYDNAKKNAENEFNDAAKIYYNQYLKEKKALPQELAALGITGGAAETSLIQLGNDYLTNLNKAQIQKNSMLGDIEAQFAQQKATLAGQRAAAETDMAQMGYDDYWREKEFNENQRRTLTDEYNTAKGLDMNAQQLAESIKNNKIANNSEELNNALKVAEMGQFSLLAKYLGVTEKEARDGYLAFIYDSILTQQGAKANFKVPSVYDGTGPEDEKGTVKNTGVLKLD